MNCLSSTLILFATHSLLALAQEPTVDESQLPRIPATEPEEAIATFEIRPGFALKLAAHEPDVVDPIAIAFDEDGGLYVVEMRGYSERREDALGRIRYLQDRDGDGVFETSTIFKDGLKWPTGIVCYKGGVFVGATPDLSYFKDTDGDGASNEERLVFTGFGSDSERLNMQALFNSFRWGPDNRIWGATGANGGAINRPDDPTFEAVSIRGADFSFDPETLDFRAENGTAQYGLSFDSLGRRFVCSNSRHAIWVAYERADLRRNPFYDPPNPLVDIANDGAAAPVFRISPDEPWRIVRTRWRVSGAVKGMVEGGGRVSGYFTSATGIHLYWGDAYGEAYRNNLFVGDVGSNLVHRKVLAPEDGQVQPVATRPEDASQTEFLRSSDNWFRPASFATGPDGCLYICDMYRETIEHPWSLPPGIKTHLDLNSGNDRGRIYRVEPEGFERPPIPKLSEASDAELAALAKHAHDDWRQTTARRLLFERGQPIPPKPVPFPFPLSLSSEEPLMDWLPEWQGDSWLEAAILNSLRHESDIMAAWENPLVADSPHFESELAKVSGRTGSHKVIEAVAAQLAQRGISSRTAELASALVDGARFSGGEIDDAQTVGSLPVLFARATAVAEDQAADTGSRLAALQLLELRSNQEDTALRKSIVADASAPEPLVAEAAKGITDGDFLVAHFDRLSDEARRSAATRLAEDPIDAITLLDSIATDEVDLRNIPADALQTLRRHENTDVAGRADTVLPKIESREDVLARYQPALAEAGDPTKGRAAFAKACVACHQTHDGEGFVFGPPIATFATAGKASVLSNIIDPNKEVAPQYQAFQFELKSGETYLGMIASEDSRNVTLRLPGGNEKTFPRTTVERMNGLGRSLMPEGLEQTLSVEEMADLLAYLTQ